MGIVGHTTSKLPCIHEIDIVLVFKNRASKGNGRHSTVFAFASWLSTSEFSL